MKGMTLFFSPRRGLVWIVLIIVLLVMSVGHYFRASFAAKIASPITSRSKILYLGMLNEVANKISDRSTVYIDELTLKDHESFILVDAFETPEHELLSLLEQADGVLLNFLVLQAMNGGGVNGLAGRKYVPPKERVKFLKHFIKYEARSKVTGSLLGDLGDYIFRGGLSQLTGLIHHLELKVLIPRFLYIPYVRRLVTALLQLGRPVRFVLLPIHTDPRKFVSEADMSRTKRPYDICIYGNFHKLYYPMRRKLQKLFHRSYEFSVLEGSVYTRSFSGRKRGEKTFKAVINGTYGESLSTALRMCKFGLATPGYMNYFVQKYFEIPRYGAAVFGIVPYDAHTVFEVENDTVSVNVYDEDKTILKKLKKALGNETARIEMVKSAQYHMFKRVSRNKYAFHLREALFDDRNVGVPRYLKQPLIKDLRFFNFEEELLELKRK